MLQIFFLIFLKKKRPAQDNVTSVDGSVFESPPIFSDSSSHLLFTFKYLGDYLKGKQLYHSTCQRQLRNVEILVFYKIL